MSNLTLLKADDVQPKWKGYNRIHGVYSLTFQVHEIYEFGSDIYIQKVDNAPEDVKLRCTVKGFLTALAMHNLMMDGKSIRLLGRFVKIGKSVLFEPLKEQF